MLVKRIHEILKRRLDIDNIYGDYYEVYPVALLEDIYMDINKDKTLRSTLQEIDYKIEDAKNIIFPVSSVNGKKNGNVIITKADIGLSNVDNTSDLNKPVSNPTRIAIQQAFDTATLYYTTFQNDKADFLNHVENYNNPHLVTKKQIGLELIENMDIIETINKMVGMNSFSAVPESHNMDVDAHPTIKSNIDELMNELTNLGGQLSNLEGNINVDVDTIISNKISEHNLDGESHPSILSDLDTLHSTMDSIIYHYGSIVGYENRASKITMDSPVIIDDIHYPSMGYLYSILNGGDSGISKGVIFDRPSSTNPDNSYIYFYDNYIYSNGTEFNLVQNTPIIEVSSTDSTTTNGNVIVFSEDYDTTRISYFYNKIKQASIIANNNYTSGIDFLFKTTEPSNADILSMGLTKNTIIFCDTMTISNPQVSGFIQFTVSTSSIVRTPLKAVDFNLNADTSVNPVTDITSYNFLNNTGFIFVTDPNNRCIQYFKNNTLQFTYNMMGMVTELHPMTITETGSTTVPSSLSTVTDCFVSITGMNIDLTTNSNIIFEHTETISGTQVILNITNISINSTFYINLIIYGRK